MSIEDDMIEMGIWDANDYMDYLEELAEREYARMENW